jgi:hypothetical protein
MNDKKYVQYKNDPNGTKWEAVYESVDRWYVKDVAHGDSMSLPKSDYILCPPPPERWTDVTAECKAYIWTWDGKADNTAYYLSHEGAMVQQNAGYRLRKVHLSGCPRWAFIIEKRED